MNKTFSHSIFEENKCCNYILLERWKCPVDSLLLFFIFILLAGAIIRQVTNQKISTNLFMLAIGAIYGVILYYWYPMTVPEFPPQNWSWKVVQIIYVPTLIFNSAFSITSRKFVQTINVFSFVLLLRSGIMVGITSGFVRYFGHSAARNWRHAILFGLIISLNSSLNVTRHLKRIGASDTTITFLSGEALLNNIFLFTIFGWTRSIILMETVTFQGILKIAFGSMASFLWGYLIGIITIKFMKRMVFNEEKSLLFMMSAVYMSSCLFLLLQSFSSSLSTFVMVLVLRSNEPCIERCLLKPLHSTLCTITFIVDRVTLISVGKVIAWILIIEEPSETCILVVPIFIIYTLIFFSRLLSTLIINGILRESYASWRTYSAAIWAQFSGASTLMLILVVYSDNILSKSVVTWDLIVATGVVVLMQLINVTVVEAVVKQMGLATVFISRRASMEYAVQRIRTAIQESIKTHKSSTRFTTTYWKWIEKYTQIINPYATGKKKLIKYESTPVPVFNQCPICQAEEEQALIRSKFESKFQPFNIEYAYRTAITVAKKSYWYQYEKRTIGWNPIKKLNSIVQEAHSTKRKYVDGKMVINRMSSSGLYDLFKELLNLISDKFVHKRNIIERRRAWTAKYKAQTNLGCWHRWTFLMGFHPKFDFITSLIILNSGILTTVSLIVNNRPRFLMADGESIVALLLEIIFFAIFSGAFAIKATAYSVKSFWDSQWNRFDLVILSITALHILVELMEAFGLFEQPAVYIYIIACVRLTRVIHCVRLIHYIEPTLMKYVTRGINTRLFENYKLGHGFIIGEEEVRWTIGRHENAKLADERLKRIVENNIREVLKELAEFHKTYPTILTAIKTHLASRRILNDVKPRLDELKYMLINESEYKILLQVFDEMLFHLSKIPKSIPVTSNRYHIVHSVEWMEKRIYTVLEQGIRFDKYPAGTTLCKQGSHSEGVFVIISGLVKITGTPKPSQSLILPNADSPYYFTEEEAFQYQAGVRESLGLLGALTKSECVTEAKCETDIEVAFIPMKQVLDGIEKLRTPPSLFYKLWRAVSVNIASFLLHKLSNYLGYSEQKVRDELANATLPYFIDSDEFWKTDEIHDIILIQGCIKSKRTKEVFYGPMYIPRHVTHMHFVGKERRCGSIIVLFLTDENYVLPSDLQWTSSMGMRRRRTGRAQTETSIRTLEDIHSDMKDTNEPTDNIE